LLELSGEVSVLEMESLREIQRLSSLPAGVKCSRRHHRGNADIHVHPTGRWLYTTNRGEGACSVTAFAVSPETGEIRAIQHQSTLGDIPRNFQITPDGGMLLVANQRDCKVVPFTIDRETGMLSLATRMDTNGNPETILTAVPESPAVLAVASV